MILTAHVEEASIQSAKSLESPSYRLALQDLNTALFDHRRWSQLAMLNLKRGYWRTRLGYLWAPLSFLAFVVMMSWLWSSVIGRDVNFYLPHFGFGVVCWVFISSMISGSEQVFSANAGIIREFPLPLTFYAFSKMAREMMVFATSMGMMILIDIVYMHHINFYSLLALPAIVVYAANGIFASLLFGMLTTRYRDVAQLIPTVMRAMFFFTPVLWAVDHQGKRGAIATWNPFYHFLEIVRAPMQGNPPTALNWMVVGGCTLLLFVLVLAFYKMGTRKIRVWL